MKAVASKCTAEVALRTRIVGSPESLGVGEQAVGQTAGMVRTLMSELEQRLGCTIPLTCRAIPWLVNLCGLVVSRFNKAEDNTTP